jgi:hypothetical protein
LDKLIAEELDLRRALSKPQDRALFRTPFFYLSIAWLGCRNKRIQHFLSGG